MNHPTDVMEGRRYFASVPINIIDRADVQYCPFQSSPLGRI